MTAIPVHTCIKCFYCFNPNNGPCPECLTPGPDILDYAPAGGEYSSASVIDMQGSLIAHVQPDIARPNVQNQRAARFAASQEMLDALGEVQEWFADYAGDYDITAGDGSPTGDLMEIIDSAISKATKQKD